MERIAREALAEVRAAVSGYRTSGLEAEVQHARNTLVDGRRAAGDRRRAAQAAAGAGGGALPGVARSGDEHRPPLRRAQLRGSSSAAVTRQCTLAIADDGRGGNAPFGSGLSGMRERVDVLGGTLTRSGTSGTTLTVIAAARTDAMQERTA